MGKTGGVWGTLDAKTPVNNPQKKTSKDNCTAEFSAALALARKRAR